VNPFAGLRNFLVIWSGQLISAIGSRLSIFALGIWVLRSTGSTTQFAMTYLAMDVPVLLVSVFAGALVDRWDRRTVMIVCDLLRAVAMFALAALLASGHLAIWNVYLGVGLVSLCSAFHSPAFQASIPLLASAQQLPRVNGMVQTGNAVAAIFGPLLAGVLVNTISLYGVLSVDASTFLVAVGGLALARIPRPRRAESEAETSVLKAAAGGWRYICRQRGLMGLLVLDGFKDFVFSIAAVLITPLLLSFTDPAKVGLQYAVSGAGMLAGGLVLTAFGAPRKRVMGILALTLACGFFLAVHGLAASFVLVTAAGFVMFLTLPMGAALYTSVWQRKVPAQLQGRCFAMQQVLSSAVTPVGYALAGPLSERVFEPLLLTGGALSGSIGAVIGVGPGRGVGLMFVLLGVLMMVSAVVAYGVATIRRIDELPDAVQADEDEPAAESEEVRTGNFPSVLAKVSAES
jgi:MFS transporter, DHA3 family, macrolide efflux protein